MINTVKIQRDGWLLNGSMLVPNAPGNVHYQMIQDWIAEGNVPDPEFTPGELAQKVTDDTNRESLAALQELDSTSIRSIREWVASQSSAPKGLKDLEAEALRIRGRIVPKTNKQS